MVAVNTAGCADASDGNGCQRRKIKKKKEIHVWHVHAEAPRAVGDTVVLVAVDADRW